MSAVSSTEELREEGSPANAGDPHGDVADEISAGEGRSLRSALRGHRGGAVVMSLAFVGVLLGAKLFAVPGTFPDGYRLRLGDRAEQLTGWIVSDMASIYTPLDAFLEGLVAWILYGLYVVPPPLLMLAFVVVAWRFAGAWIALLAIATLALTVSFSLWDAMKETLALMIVAVILASVLGVAVGIVSSLHRRLEMIVRILLDAMQTYPMFAYLVPALVIFGAGTTAALVVTVVWAMPPIARMTIVGIRTVSEETVEAARAQGVTRPQLLVKVLLPLARPSILAGLNQTIMFAMTMAIIASMIGAGGLGDPVWTRLRLLQFGPALEAGIILVFMAIIMDRATSRVVPAEVAVARRESRTGHRWRVGGPMARWRVLPVVAVGGGVTVTVVLNSVLSSRGFSFSDPPERAQLSLEGGVDSAIDWLNINLGDQFDALTQALQNFAINPTVDLLAWVPWPAALLGVLAIGWMALGGRGAGLAVGAATLVGLLGMWDPALYTFGFVAVATAVTVVLGVPLGILCAQSDWAAGLARPVLDAMQTLPIFLFVIPSVVLLGPGPAAGLIATIALAIPPVIRLTNVAIRGTDPEIVEAATIFGTTQFQMLRKVRLVMGLPTILVGLNQAVMLALAMAVVSAFIGTPGLGQLILLSVSDADMALGVQAGVAMFLVAVVTDRVMHGAVRAIARTPSKE